MTGTEPAPLTTEEREELNRERSATAAAGASKVAKALTRALERLDFLEAKHGPKKMGRPASLTDKQVSAARRAVALGMPFHQLVAKMKVDELALRRAVVGLTFRHITNPAPAIIPSSKTSTQTVAAPKKKTR